MRARACGLGAGGPLDDEALDRYARHLVLREVGGAGQARLAKARVLIVGLGGLGCPAALYLAAAGVGTIGLIDPDRVSLSNLQRQVLYQTADVGRPKVEVARAALLALDPRLTINAHHRPFGEGEEALLADYDLIADGTDNAPARHLVNRACVTMGRPLVSAAISRFSGQVAVFRAGTGGTGPCYRCFARDDDRAGDDCAELGILGAVAGTVGSMLATEVCKEILRVGESLAGRLLLYDALDARTETIRIARDPHCPVCGDSDQK